MPAESSIQESFVFRADIHWSAYGRFGFAAALARFLQICELTTTGRLIGRRLATVFPSSADNMDSIPARRKHGPDPLCRRIPGHA